jgi:hypothetical protein
MNPDRLPTTGAGESADMKKALIRVAFSDKQIAAARELGKREHASVAQIARRALQKAQAGRDPKEILPDGRKDLTKEQQLEAAGISITTAHRYEATRRPTARERAARAPGTSAFTK